MKADHINDLRRKINQARAAIGLGPVNWGPDVSPSDPVRASHATSIRDEIRFLWLAKSIIGQPSSFPSFDTGEPTDSKAIFALDTNDNRLWLKRAENHPAKQGISSLAHDPGSANSFVGDAWVADLRNLQPNPAKRIVAVRCVIGKAGEDVQTPTPGQVARYVNDFNKYRDPGPSLPGYQVFAVLNKQTFTNGQFNNDDLSTLNGVPLTNAYIEGYAPAMTSLMREFYTRALVSDFILWNEPNSDNLDKKLDSDRFAALLRRTWLYAVADPILGPRMLADPPLVRLYWGGIFMGGTESVPDAGNIQYIKDVYSHIEVQKAMASDDYGSNRDWPWHGINVHPHLKRNATYTGSLFRELNDELRVPKSDGSDTLIGEWGIKLEGPGHRSNPRENYPDTRTGDLLPTYLAFRDIDPTFMFYFSHHWNPDANLDDWGVRSFFFGGEEFVPCADSPQTFPAISGYWGLPGRLGPASFTLYDALTNALGQ